MVINLYYTKREYSEKKRKTEILEKTNVDKQIKDKQKWQCQNIEGTAKGDTICASYRFCNPSRHLFYSKQVITRGFIRTEPDAKPASVVLNY